MKAKRCAICGRYFQPYSRNASRQILCGRRECRQSKKQEMARVWWKNNPDGLSERHKKKRAWAKACGYWSTTRKNNPEYTARNREQTRERMRRLRAAQAKYAAPQKNPIAYLEGLKCPEQGLSGEMFANQYSLAAQLDGVCDYLIGREMFANQCYPDKSGREMVKLSNGGDSS